MLHSTVVGRLWGEPEERLTLSGKTLITLTVSYKDKSTKKYHYVLLRIWGDKFNKLIPYLKHGTTVFVSGPLTIESYFSRTKGEAVASVGMTVDTLQILFSSSSSNSENKEVKQEEKVETIKDTEETTLDKPEIRQEDKRKEKKEEEDEDLDWGGAVFGS